MSDEGSGAGAAACARHPEQVASGVCATCGRNTCEACGPGPQCPLCREPAAAGAGSAAFPLPRERFRFGAVWTASVRAFEREWLLLSVAVLLTLLVPGLLSMVSGVAGVAFELADLQLLSFAFRGLGALVQLVAQLVLTVGMMRLVLDALQGRRVDLAAMLQAVRTLPQYLLAMLLVLLVALPVLGALVGLGFLGYHLELLQRVPEWVVAGGLVTVGLFWATLPLLLLPVVFAHEPGVDALGSLRSCYRMAAGFRLPLLGVVLLGTGLSAAGLLLCCVGALPAFAFYQLMVGALFLALRARELPGRA